MTVKTSIGNITAPKEVLHILSVACARAYEVCDLIDFDKLDREIYHALRENGYYDILPNGVTGSESPW